MKHPSKLIHIGLAKSMSSTLQVLWSHSNNYVAIDPKGVTSKTDSFFDQHRDNIDALVARLENSSPPFGFEPNDGLQVLSGEGLASSWFCHMPELSEHIPKRQQLLATMFGPLADKILIVIRDPVDWIRSAYAQMLKEGGYLSVESYVREFKVSIEKNLDLRALVTSWQQYDAEIVILPMELYKQDQDAFWIAYEGMLAMPRPDISRSVDVHSNPSVYETLGVHKSVNRILSILETVCVEDQKNPVKDVFIEGLKAARLWGARSAMERLSSDQLIELKSLLALEKEQGNLEIPTELAEHLQKNRGLSGRDRIIRVSDDTEGYQQSVSSLRRPRH